MPRKQRRVALDDVAQRQPVAQRHLGEHDDFQARVQYHLRLAHHRFLLLLDVLGQDLDPAPVRFFSVGLERHHLVERVVVADVVSAVLLQGVLPGDALDAVDRQQVTAVRIEHDMLAVLFDYQRRIGAGVGTGVGTGCCGRAIDRDQQAAAEGGKTE